MVGAAIRGACVRRRRNKSPCRIHRHHVRSADFCAVENGFFKDEGLEVELVKCEWSKYKDVLALGGFDVAQHLIMYFIKPIEQGA
jgi:hypothetical protein